MLPPWSKVTMAVLGVLLVLALAFAIVKPIKVLPRIRLAPGYSLTDQSGARFDSEMARSTVTLYNFAPLVCDDQCRAMERTIADVRRRVADVDLGGKELRLVTITLADDPSTDQVAAAAAAAGADGTDWRWVGGSLEEIRTVVGGGFEQYVEVPVDAPVRYDSGFVLVDAEGIIRAEYRYETLSSNADRMVRQIGLLGDEIRNSHGVASAAYEAAHLFLCYG